VNVLWHFPLGAREVITHFDIREKSRDYAEKFTTAQNLVSWVCALVVLYFHEFYIVLHQDMQFRFFLDLPSGRSSSVVEPRPYNQFCRGKLATACHFLRHSSYHSQSL